MTDKIYKCRQCGGAYDSQKSRALVRGYCSRKCQRAKAKACGYNPKEPGSHEYSVLRQADALGDVPILEGCRVFMVPTSTWCVEFRGRTLSTTFAARGDAVKWLDKLLRDYAARQRQRAKEEA